MFVLQKLKIVFELIKKSLQDYETLKRKKKSLLILRDLDILSH